jgi:hypothetical protein
MQAVATTMGSTAFTELSAAHRAMLNAAMPARSNFANDTLDAVYQNLRWVPLWVTPFHHRPGYNNPLSVERRDIV